MFKIYRYLSQDTLREIFVLKISVHSLRKNNLLKDAKLTYFTKILNHYPF